LKQTFAPFLFILFFTKTDTVTDKEILPLVEQTLDKTNPREWYYALMDYGVSLKKTHANPSCRSAHHTKQSRFEGSDRQIRGMILRLLTQHTRLTKSKLIAATKQNPARANGIIQKLSNEGFIKKEGDLYSIT